MKLAPGRKEEPVRRDLVRQNLDGHYGSIAMPALAAALRYSTDSRSPAPTDPKDPKASGPEQEAA
jgi:hypothetical protein